MTRDYTCTMETPTERVEPGDPDWPHTLIRHSGKTILTIECRTIDVRDVLRDLIRKFDVLALEA